MPDYMFLLESRLSPEQRQVLAGVQAAAQAHQLNVYLTGGAVRDLITGMPIRDLDFTVEGAPSRIARDLEKQGAQVVEENERLRQIDMTTSGGVDFSLAAARDEGYEHPGARPETRWSTIMDDLRRRDFSINAIALSLNPASRGLLLDPTNGLADLEKREVRVLTVHAFTNQPVRLLRILRFCARLDFRMESRTAEWFALAMERGLHESLEGDPVGEEVRQLAREDRCAQILKAWASRALLGVIHPRLARRQPDYDNLMRLMKARELFAPARLQPRLFAPVMHYVLARLSPRERSSAMHRIGLRAAEIASVQKLEGEALKVVKVLKTRKTDKPRDAYDFLEQVSPGLMAFILAEYRQPRVLNKIRNYLAKWRPMRLSPPVADLEALGVPQGPKFAKILDDFFYRQIAGKGRNPQDRIRILRQLAGIKPEKKKEKEKEPKKKGKGAPAEEAPKGKGKPTVASPAAPAAQAAEAHAEPRASARTKAAAPAKTAVAGKGKKPYPARTAPAEKRAKAVRKAKAKPVRSPKQRSKKKR
jgi:tRNA nucleotidyltransferase/poly(A) polymerase